jgi:acetyltransferase
MFGLGGIFVEAIGDVVFRLAPLDDAEAAAMVGAIRSAPILDGIRGQPPADRAALADILLHLAQLATRFPEIAELDVNPLIPTRSGLLAVDARVRLSGGAR